MSYRTPKRIKVVLDIECYRDYFLVMFSRMDSEKFRGFEQYDGHPLDRRGIIKLLKKYTVVTFNGRSYDMPILAYALTGVPNNRDLKAASDTIIQGNMKPWDFEDHFGVKVERPEIDHIDLIEIPAGDASLKLYGGRIHMPLMQDLPFHHADFIFEPGAGHTKREIMYNYCGNDLSTTKGLYNHLLKVIELREEMGDRYGIDLRSKSDAQVAEAAFKKRLEDIKGTKIYKPKNVPSSFEYEAPDFVSFETPLLQRVLRIVNGATYKIVSDKLEVPEEVRELKIRIGDTTYTLLNGGLHSKDSRTSHHAGDDYILCDRDVRSYYPSIMLKMRLFPAHLGEKFLTVLEDFYWTRLKAKDIKDTKTADMLKIVLNSSFGKFGNKWSILYSPKLLIQTTVTGQLCLLMLIEALEEEGISVVSANTDGVVIKCPRRYEAKMNLIVSEWEKKTSFVMEDTQYKSIYSRDVNNYIAIHLDGKVKSKGAYNKAGISKNPATWICVEAVINLLTKGVPLEDTIYWGENITDYISIKKVAGGGEQCQAYEEVDDWVEIADRQWQRQAIIDDPFKDQWVGTVKRKSRPKPVMVGGEPKFLGKAVRWYYSKSSPGPITAVGTGNKVGKTEGALELMNLPDEMPTDIDYEWYMNESIGILRDIAADEFLEAYR